jgi:hypothetical protein
MQGQVKGMRIAAARCLPSARSASQIWPMTSSGIVLGKQALENQNVLLPPDR